MNTGLIGKKIGMTQAFLENGRVLPVTAIQAGPCTVVQLKTEERDGYQAVQLGFGSKKYPNKPEVGHLKGLGPFGLLREFRVASTEGYEIGQVLQAGMFSPGDTVDVSGRSRGMGFAGGVKRHNFRGGPKTHGQSDRHRAPGSIGAGTTPGRVVKGLRMAGHMGDELITTQNLEVIGVDEERDLLLIRGAIPGAKNSYVVIRPATKGKRRSTLAETELLGLKPVVEEAPAEEPEVVEAPEATTESEAPEPEADAEEKQD